MGGRLASAVAVVVCILWAAWAAGQEASPMGLVEDWSQKHVIFTNGGSADVVAQAQRDPRNLQQWLHRSWYLFHGRPARDFRDPEPNEWFLQQRGWRREARLQTDWAMPLGGNGGMPIGETPAKFTFNATAPLSFPASCNNDFVVYAINASTAAAGTQANIVAFNNLYTGTTSSSCPNGPQSPVTTNRTTPTFMWSYAVGSGPVYLSPVLSLDGKKVAFIEAAPSGGPVFHVLTWVTGQGTNATTGSVAPGTGGSSATSLAFTNTTVAGCAASVSNDSDSSPFVDYGHDVAYIGADNGRLYRIKGVFNGTPTLDYCVTVSAGKLLTSPVYDSISGKVFVSDGQAVYAFTPGATSFTAAGSLSVAATATSVVLSPIVDSTNGYVYVFSSHDLTNTNSIVSQMPVSLATHVDAPIGPASATFVLDGAFDNKYFANGPASGSLYACGTQAGASNKPGLYTLTFAASGQMNTTPAMSNNRNINTATNPAGYCSPLLEYYDGTNDRLFVGAGNPGTTTGGNLVTAWNINSRITSATATPAASATNQFGGSSAFSIDNNSSAFQASSIYFGTLATSPAASCGANQYCAVKLTQSGLQ
jgi:hypothetical protein